MAENKKATGGPSGGHSEKGHVDNNLYQPKLQDRISGYDGISPTPTRELLWLEALKEIRSGKHRTSVLAARKVLVTQGKDAYAASKRGLPGVTFGGTFSHRKNDGICLSTGIIVADIHGCDVCKTKEALSDDKNIWFAFTSPGREGIKAGLRAQGIRSDSDHKRFFSAVEKYFSEVYNITIDRACKDISRLTFLSYDHGAFINPDPTFFNIEAWAAENTLNKITLPQIPTNSNGGSKAKYARKVLDSACQKIMQSTPGNMHNTRLAMARLAGGYLYYGIGEAEALQALEQAVKTSATTDFAKAMKTIRDGLENGKQSPVEIPETEQHREVPPLTGDR
ncbi:MAG: BT4734/BF3469 family protein [Desulfobacterales bacterium]